MKKKALAWIISVSVLFTSIMPHLGHTLAAEAVSAVETTEEAVPAAESETAAAGTFAAAVEYEEEKIHEILVPYDEKRTVEASVSSDGEWEYQWQILADVPSELWVNIMGQNGRTMEVSAPMIASVMDSASGAYIRCEVTDGEQKVYTEPVCVSISYMEEKPEKMRKMAAEAAPEEEAQISALAEGDEEKEYVYIRIHYLDAVTGKTLYTSYTSQLEKGTGFDDIILSPTYLGFAPYYYPNDLEKENADPDKDNPDKASDDHVKLATSLNFKEILKDSECVVNDDVTVNVFYWAQDVPYTISYFFQNILDDSYEERGELHFSGTAKTGTIIEDEVFVEHANNPKGFTMLYHYPEAVAADGSTNFECYYDRNYYLLKFDMDGGYGTEPIYARYDTPFLVNQPIRAGYEFVGWDRLEYLGIDEESGLPLYGEGDGIPDEMPKKIPAENQQYKALWKAVKSSYTTVYWKENANDDGYSFWGYRQAESQAGTIETVANVYYDRNLYTVVFYASQPSGEASTLDYICGYEEHTHTEDCYQRICMKEEHTHDSSCMKCTKEEHTAHTPECYGAQSEWKEAQPGDGGYEVVTKLPKQAGYVYRAKIGSYYTTLYNYFCDGNNWYYLGEGVNGTLGLTFQGDDPTSGKAKVSEVASTLVCEKELHTHTAECFSCNKTAHTHTREECDVLCCDRNTEHAHKMSCAKPEHTHSTQCKKNYLFPKLTIRAKYEQDIASLWPTEEVMQQYSYLSEKKHLELWTVPSSVNNGTQNQTTKILEMTSNLCNNGSRVVTVPAQFTTTSTLWSVKYYFKSQDQTSEANGDRRVQYKGLFYDIDDRYTQSGYKDGVNWNPKEIVGYEKGVAGTFGQDGIFYYQPKKYELSFQNHGEILEEKTETLEYRTDISGKNFEPPYPDTLEEHAYVFDGWYTTPGCIPGSEFVFENAKMPADNLQLYAKWSPIEHEVRFFRTYDDMVKYRETGDISGMMPLSPMRVPHGMVVGGIANPDAWEENGVQYSFGGWFYEKNGEKVAFTPLDSPIVKDMDIFADWGSLTAQPFRIKYENYRTGEEIAKESFGFAMQGTTRTFTPKLGAPMNQLYDLTDSGGIDYNKGYYPTLASHSITLKYEENIENPAKNIHTFRYIYAENVPYRVRYVDLNGVELLPHKDGTTNSAVITERFQPIENYLPDAVYHRLVTHVEVDEDGKNITKPEDNLITFVYTPAQNKARYITHHLLMIPGTAGLHNPDFEESPLHKEGIGEIHEWMEEDVHEFAGYTVANVLDENSDLYGQPAGYVSHIETDEEGRETIGWRTAPVEENDNGEQVVRFMVTQKGTEVYIYYILKKYPYTVKYLEYGTGEKLATSKTSDPVHFKTTHTEKPIAIQGYVPVSGMDEEKSVTIAVHDDKSKPDPNVITFYYEKEKYQVSYQQVVDGVLSNDVTMLTKTLETVIPSSDDSQKEFEGSAAMPQQGYQFDGWYLDAECTKPLLSDDKYRGWISSTDAALENNKIVPVIENDLLKPSPDMNTFYAKFSPLAGDLTIERENARNEGSGNQIYVYRLTDENGNVFSVTVKTGEDGKGSTTIHDLPCGKYQVEEISDWSWRFPAEKKENIDHKSEGTTLNFGRMAERQRWLNGNSEVKANIRKEEPER